MNDSTLKMIEEIVAELEVQVSTRDDEMEAMRKRAAQMGEESRERYARGYQLGMDEVLMTLRDVIEKNRVASHRARRAR